MSETIMIDSGELGQIKHTLLGVEKAIVELATMQKESAKREERLYTRIDKLEQQMQSNTTFIWKLTGGITALVGAFSIVSKFI